MIYSDLYLYFVCNLCHNVPDVIPSGLLQELIVEGHREDWSEIGLDYNNNQDDDTCLSTLV